MKFTYPIEPVAKERPRLGRYGVYDSPAQAKRTREYRWTTKQQMVAERVSELAQGPIEASMRFYMPFPSKCNSEARNALEGEWCDKSKDVDNMAKFYMDVFNKLAYHDDRQISRLVCEKIYSSEPSVEIELNPLPLRRGLDV